MLVLVMAASAFVGPASHLAGRTGHASLRRPSSPQMVEGSPSQNEVGGGSIPAVGGAASILAGVITWVVGGRSLPQLGGAVLTVGTIAAAAAGLRKDHAKCHHASRMGCELEGRPDAATRTPGRP